MTKVHPEHLKPEHVDEVNISVEHPVSQRNWIDDEPQQEALWPDLQHTGAVSQELRARCAQMGMKSGAVDGWAQYHTSPVVAMTYHFFGQLLLLLVVCYLLTGAPFSRFFYSIPYTLAVVMQLGHIAFVWHTGPDVSSNTLLHRSIPGKRLSCARNCLHDCDSSCGEKFDLDSFCNPASAHWPTVVQCTFSVWWDRNSPASWAKQIRFRSVILFTTLPLWEYSCGHEYLRTKSALSTHTAQHSPAAATCHRC